MNRKAIILALIFFTVLTIILTFPLILNISNCCLGFSSTDELLVPIWNYWYLQYSGHHGLDSLNTDFIAFPFKFQVFGVVSYVYLGLILFLSNIFNYIVVLNIQILLNFILTGFFTYLLVNKITGSRLSGLFSGIIFAFCPQHFMRSWQHITLSYFQWMPLYIFALFELRQKKGFRQALLLGLALFLNASFDLHYLFFMSIATVVFLFACFSFDKQRLGLKFFRNLFIGLSLFSFFFLLQFYQYLFSMLFKKPSVASAYSIFRRPFEDLFAQSARPLSYFLPSTEHPFFGGLTQMFIGSPVYGDSLTEHNLYLGWVALALAFIGCWLYRKYRAQFREDSFAVKFFLLLGVISWVFSQPPWWQIGSVKVYMPSFFIYKVLPVFRAYCRFGIVLMLAIAVLAGFGIKYLLINFKNNFKKIFIFIILCLLVIFDFWNNPWQHVVDLSKHPAVYDWLKSQEGDFVIAEYPLDVKGSNDFYKFFQTIHEKKMINGTVPGTPANEIAQSMIRLSDPKVLTMLKEMSVKYIIVHQDEYLKTEIIDEIEELRRIQQSKGLRLFKSFDAQECFSDEALCLSKTGPVSVYELRSGLE